MKTSKMQNTQGCIPRRTAQAPKDFKKKSLQRAKITGNTKLGEVMQINPEAGMILFEYGLHCVGCGLASMETLEQGCLAHGMSKKEINEILSRLNKEDKQKKKSAKKKTKTEENKIKKLPSKKISSNKLKEIIE